MRARAHGGSGRPLHAGGDLRGAVFEAEEDVLRLDVGVDDALAVDILQSSQQLPGHLLDSGIEKGSCFLN